MHPQSAQIEIPGSKSPEIQRSLPDILLGFRYKLNSPLPAASPLSGYSRMFPDLPLLAPADPAEAGLIALGAAMTEVPAPTATLATPKAGYTYLGQFIDHDLTLDLTPLSRAGETDLSQMVNFRLPGFNLDQLYGGGPDVWPFLYERADLRSAARFLIGPTTASSVNGKDFPSSPNDLPRSAEGIALVGDPRQDENLVIAQLHVAFLKLHNAIIGNAEMLAASPHYKNAGSKFDAARRVLTWHYQWVVRYDFLRQILDEQVFNALDELERTQRGAGAADFRMPVEFSLGAFRFGHSMVREDYFYNDTHRRARLLEDLLMQTGVGGGAVKGLPADWVIDWQRFFFVGAGDGMARHSSAINTELAQGLHKLPGGPNDSPHLAVRTLQRGERVRLPSGQAVATALEVPALSPDQLLSGPHKPILEKYGYETQTPLWYYLLKEAEVMGKGERLGPAGSHIVARVFMNALLSDPNSYLSIDPAWVPTLPGPIKPQLFGMAHLLGFMLRGS
jgi:hypothetical protein